MALRLFHTAPCTRLVTATVEDKNNWHRMISETCQVDDAHWQNNNNLLMSLRVCPVKNCTPAQLALAWVLAQGDDMIPIPGTKRRKYLEENAAAQTLL